MKKRTNFYIDGFNFYYGIKSAKKKLKYGDYRWLDYQKLAENIIKPYQELKWVKYFTANIKADISKIKRQNAYLEALALQPKMKIYYGNYQIKQSFDKNLGKYISYPVEKRTDVNIATQLLVDAFQNEFDFAYVVTGDSDLLPAIEAIRQHLPGLFLISCFPPMRTSFDLKAACQGCYNIKEKVLKKSLLPDSITKPDTFVIQRPADWR